MGSSIGLACCILGVTGMISGEVAEGTLVVAELGLPEFAVEVVFDMLE